MVRVRVLSGVHLIRSYIYSLPLSLGYGQRYRQMFFLTTLTTVLLATTGLPPTANSLCPASRDSTFRLEEVAVLNGINLTSLGEKLTYTQHACYDDSVENIQAVLAEVHLPFNGDVENPFEGYLYGVDEPQNRKHRGLCVPGIGFPHFHSRPFLPWGSSFSDAPYFELCAAFFIITYHAGACVVLCTPFTLANWFIKVFNASTWRT